VSLLIDALKKAEQAKQQGQSDAESGLSLEATMTPESGTAPTTPPRLPKLEELDAEFSAHASRPAGQRQAAATGSAQQAGASAHRGAQQAWTNDSAQDAAIGREAIRNAFAAKGGVENDRKGILIAAALGLLVVGGIGAWFWLQFKPVQGLVAPRPPAGQNIATRQDIAPPPSVTTDNRLAVPAKSAAVQSMPAVSVPKDSADSKQLAKVRPVAPFRMARRPVAAPVEADATIRVTSAAQGVDPGVVDGYRLLQSGNLNGARAAYAGVLKSDPRNADALHGIAAILLREGRVEEAAVVYQRILETNPADASAQASLIGLNGQGDPVASESRIKSLLAIQPKVPVLNFALGNLYARQDRWDEAQQAYFKAVTEDGNNPDYLFNLAVSLDQMHQPRLAAQYYGRALLAAENRPAAFDRAQASGRLRQLQP
jgi:tetratricopeptide (TPR) repeat protein